MTDRAPSHQMLKEYADHYSPRDWAYTRNRGDLVHIRYKSDYTGYDAWWRRLRRGLDWKHLTGRDSISKAFGREKQPISTRLMWAWAWFRVSVRKDSNLPDGVLNGGTVITFWEEDGEYINLVQPSVGSLLADFLREDAQNPHAVKITAEIDRIRDEYSARLLAEKTASSS